LSNYKIVTDAAGKLLAYGPNRDEYVPTVPQGCAQSVVTENELILMTTPVSKSKAQLMSEELISLATDYKVITTQLMFNWLTASVNDGVEEESKKAGVLGKLAAAKTKYTADILAIRSKYA